MPADEASFARGGEVVQLRVKSPGSRPIFRAKSSKTYTFRKDHISFSRSQTFLKILNHKINSSKLYTLRNFN